MVEMNWKEFDKAVDTEGLNKDLQESHKNGGMEYVDVPDGEYEVSVESMELKLSKSSQKPMVAIRFKILTGNYKNQSIFYNQVITQGFQIHLNHEFLKSMDTGVEIPNRFTGYEDYEILLDDIFKAILDQNLEFALRTSENDKGFKTYTITDVFEA